MNPFVEWQADSALSARSVLIDGGPHKAFEPAKKGFFAHAAQRHRRDAAASFAR
jgi:hypothetical protein